MQTTFIGIISSKGGVGKTTTAINLAAALNNFGRQVVLVDGNYQKPNVGLMLGITKVDCTLHHALRGESGIEDAVYVHPSGLHVVPGSIIYDDLYKDHTRKLQDILLSLRGKTEAVIVDCGPGFSTETADVLSAIDKVILVTTPDLASVTDTMKSRTVCKERGIDILGTIITHAGDTPYNPTAADVEAVIDEKVIGEIPYDEMVKEAAFKKYPVIFVADGSPATIAYKKAAANLIGETYSPVVEQTALDYLLKRIGFK